MGYLKAVRKLFIAVPLATLSLLPTLAHSDSELPTNVVPKPSEPDFEQLMSMLRNTPENGWVRVNTNRIEDVFTPTELLVSTTKTPDSNPWGPRGIIGAYSGFTWDSRRGDLIIYGGGHANYGGNDLYRFKATTLTWERMSLPSDVLTLGPTPWLTVDGADASPPSAHTYDNNIYLPIADRFLTFGGPIFGNGEPFEKREPDNSTRITGPYFFDPARADANKVGGLTGSHSQWDNPNSWVIGGEMWENRDVPLNVPSADFTRHFVEGSTGYKQENGKDVVYVHGAYANLSKYTVNDLDDPTQDTWERVGLGGDGAGGGPGTAAYLPTLDLYVRASTNLFSYWDLSTPSATNPNVPFVPDGDFVAMSTGLYNYGLGDYGMDYDAPRNRFLLWVGGRDVWSLTPPAVVSPNGWSMEKLASPPGPNPYNAAGSGILGKWKYLAQLDAFITLQQWYDGNIWIYKPENWVEPISDDPHITITEPSSKGYFLPNDDIVVSAAASNAQATITQVELLMDGQTIAVLTQPPYTTTVTSVQLGVYTFEAIATDSNGDAWISPRVSATVANHVNNPPSVSMTAPFDGETVIYVDGRTVPFTADASDSDGTIAEVEFFLNGVSVGVDTTAPYSILWDAQQGTHMLTAIATDDTNITTVSAATQLNVTPPGDGDLIILQDGLDGYAGTNDTYLDAFHTTFPKGNKEWINSSNVFNPLLRFDIFANEGGPVPEGANISYAALAVYKSSYYNFTYRAYPVLIDWIESAATWIEADSGTPWNMLGAAGANSDYSTNGSPERYTEWEPGWIVMNVTDSVQAMSQGTQNNYGWQMLGTGPNYQKTFRSSEYAADPMLRPKLIIQIGEEANMNPSVSLQSPSEGSLFSFGENITFSANAEDMDGSVAQVEFFYSIDVLGVNNVSLGVDTSAPYSVTANDTPAGVVKLTAVATDDDDASTTSAEVTILALPPGC